MIVVPVAFFTIGLRSEVLCSQVLVGYTDVSNYQSDVITLLETVRNNQRPKLADTVMKSFPRVTFAFVVTLLTSFGYATAENPSGTKILLIGKQPDHPWGTHMYLHTCQVLTKCLAQTDGVTAVVSDGWPTDAEALKGVKTIVVYTTPAAELLLDGPHRDQVDALMKNGVGLVTIHWASSVLQQDLDRLGASGR